MVQLPAWWAPYCTCNKSKRNLKNLKSIAQGGTVSWEWCNSDRHNCMKRQTFIMSKCKDFWKNLQDFGLRCIFQSVMTAHEAGGHRGYSLLKSHQSCLWGRGIWNMICAPQSASTAFPDREITTMAELPSTPTPFNVRENVTRNYPAKATVLNEKHTGWWQCITCMSVCAAETSLQPPKRKEETNK